MLGMNGNHILQNKETLYPVHIYRDLFFLIDIKESWKQVKPALTSLVGYVGKKVI